MDKYEEALEKARQLCVLPTDRAILEEIFPELRVSEDERIRKEMIEIIKNEAHEFPASVIANKSNSWIAWLEKQGEHANFCNKIQIGDKVTRNRDGVLVNLSQLNRVAKPAEKQDEQKPADKVEPKFKVGDILVSDEEDRRHIYKVDAITNYDTYLLLDLEDGYTRNESVYTSDLAMYLWTIEDAKEGDVLVTHSGIVFIFKNIMEGATISFHAALSTSNFASNTKIHIPEDNEQLGDQEVFPATKEQRDTLMKAMADAGYTFDFEKKELKKIEQKLDDKVEPIFNVGDKIQYSKGCGTIMTIEKIENGEYVFANNMGHTTIECGNKWYLVEQKPSWSEEDKEMLNQVIEDIVKLAGPYVCYHKDVDWLKSLKDRVQPKQEWSEEDEKKLLCICAWIKDYPRIADFKDEMYTVANNYIDWLKSLRPQNTWKPSDEQMNAFDAVLVYNPPCSNECRNHLITLYNDLKKLREK